jgi:hypothetical protein
MINLNNPKQILEYLSQVKQINSDFIVLVPYLSKHPNDEIRNRVSLILANSTDPEYPESREYLSQMYAQDTNPEIRARAQQALNYDLENRINSVFSKPKPESNVVTKRVRRKTTSSSYIRIPGTNTLISRGLVVTGKNWKETHFELAANGLYMPRIDVFMKHYSQVLDCEEDELELIDENGRRLDETETDEVYFNVMETSCWLDAHFDGSNLITDHRIVDNTLIGKVKPLDRYYAESGDISLNFLNKQGLPTKLTRHGDLRYSQPKEDCVVGFLSHPHYRPDFFCDVPIETDITIAGSFGCKDVPK